MHELALPHISQTPRLCTGTPRYHTVVLRICGIKENPGRLGPMIALRNAGLLICSPEECSRLGRDTAVTFLQRCISDPSSMLQLRALLHRYRGAATPVLDDRGVVEQIALLIESGELMLLREAPEFAKRGAGGGPVASDRPPLRHAVRQSARSTTAVQPLNEEATFPPNIDFAAMADTLQRAAGSGIPFCPP